MTPELLSNIESDILQEAWIKEELLKLVDEVRASWNAIIDLRQDSDAYRRAIADAVRIVADNMDAYVYIGLAKLIGDLALTKQEFNHVWAGEASPRGRIYDMDVDSNFPGGRFIDEDTGEEFMLPAKRWCAEQGWIEVVEQDASGNYVRPLTIKRVWRRFRFELAKTKDEQRSYNSSGLRGIK